MRFRARRCHSRLGFIRQDLRCLRRHYPQPVNAQGILRSIYSRLAVSNFLVMSLTQNCHNVSFHQLSNMHRRTHHGRLYYPRHTFRIYRVQVILKRKSKILLIAGLLYVHDAYSGVISNQIVTPGLFASTARPQGQRN